MTRTVHLLVIDPQNDFCDLPTDWQPGHAPAGQAVAPALPVAGAHADMQRLAAFLRPNAQHIDAVTVTLDSHQRYDVAHPGFWLRGDGAAVSPFTPITAQQVRSGQFAPADAAALPRVLAYLDALEAQGRYTLMVWPVHCEIGSWGHGLHADVLAACGAWQTARQRAVQHVFKGMNPWTEHYSALQAEVPDPADPATALDTRLLQRLGESDLLLIGGEASSHCVRATTEHIVQHLPRLQPGWSAERVVLLTDCMSPVAGFEAQHAAFLQAMRAQGVQLADSSEIRL
ncbi:cysteine hydrolase [Paracidovorax wautersii]|uniref:Nicotinamidase/pyrazinamidase n=1 Tax=Paracidovorax wautersii TaxID=1177982 RepID=A0ABU1IB34_9BURK|nr:cysteine hydrolase [Paracidovorax wautersii]MDR6214439.1 nicotinamidase/pyrazinamidase [Paracidovorax wautersii]